MSLSTLLSVLFALAFLYLFWKIMSSLVGGEVEQPEEYLEQVSEYRTHMVNQWATLLGFWFGVEVTKDMVKLTMPDYNLNVLYFYIDDIEVATYFDWGKDTIVVKATVYNGEEGYWCRSGIFSMKHKVFEVDKLHKFIEQVKIEHYELHELTADDVIDIARQLKDLNQPFQNDAAAKRYYFNVLADLLMLARRRKFRHDKKFMKIYASFFHHMWNTMGEEFIEFLNEDEAPQQKEESTEE